MKFLLAPCMGTWTQLSSSIYNMITVIAGHYMIQVGIWPDLTWWYGREKQRCFLRWNLVLLPVIIFLSNQKDYLLRVLCMCCIIACLQWNNANRDMNAGDIVIIQFQLEHLNVALYWFDLWFKWFNRKLIKGFHNRDIPVCLRKTEMTTQAWRTMTLNNSNYFT